MSAPATFSNELTDTEQTYQVDHLFVEQGTQPVAALYHDLRDYAWNKGVTDVNALIAVQPQPQIDGEMPGFELHRIGDAVSSRTIHSAVYDALRLCITL